MRKEAIRGILLTCVLSKSSIHKSVLLADWMRSIINVMKYWMTTPYFKVDTNVLSRMMEFASSVQSLEPMNKLAQELYSTTANRVWFHYFSQRLIFVSPLATMSAADFPINTAYPTFRKSNNTHRTTRARHCSPDAGRRQVYSHSPSRLYIPLPTATGRECRQRRT